MENETKISKAVVISAFLTTLILSLFWMPGFIGNDNLFLSNAIHESDTVVDVEDIGVLEIEDRLTITVVKPIYDIEGNRSLEVRFYSPKINQLIICNVPSQYAFKIDTEASYEASITIKYIKSKSEENIRNGLYSSYEEVFKSEKDLREITRAEFMFEEYVIDLGKELCKKANGDDIILNNKNM